MNIALITGSAGLIGSEAVSFFADKFDLIIGLDNNLRKYFFGEEGSTAWNLTRLKSQFSHYQHHEVDIRDVTTLEKIFKTHTSDIKFILHTAAQPSHDWAAKEPFTDFSVNANGTLNLLEMTRLHCPEAVFVFTSTNKVYGDSPNHLPLVEMETRWEIENNHPYSEHGIDENLSIDQSKHSVFGASKVAADIMVQEYGKYFNLKTGIFRGGCLTGPNHSGAKLHGFLNYLMKCALTGEHYTIYGYKGKQVRDNIHSYDLVNMFWHFYQHPRPGEVYNAGGGRYSNCSVLEAMQLCQDLTGKKMSYSYSEKSRIGDHIWWISDLSKFRDHFPAWHWKFDLESIMTEIHKGLVTRTHHTSLLNGL